MLFGIIWVSRAPFTTHLDLTFLTTRRRPVRTLKTRNGHPKCLNLELEHVDIDINLVIVRVGCVPQTAVRVPVNWFDHHVLAGQSLAEAVGVLLRAHFLEAPEQGKAVQVGQAQALLYCFQAVEVDFEEN